MQSIHGGDEEPNVWGVINGLVCCGCLSLHPCSCDGFFFQLFFFSIRFADLWTDPLNSESQTKLCQYGPKLILFLKNAIICGPTSTMMTHLGPPNTDEHTMQLPVVVKWQDGKPSGSDNLTPKICREIKPRSGTVSPNQVWVDFGGDVKEGERQKSESNNVGQAG